MPLALALLVGVPVAAAQRTPLATEQPVRTRVAVSVGSGIGAMGAGPATAPGLGLGGRFALSVERPRLVVTLRSSGALGPAGEQSVFLRLGGDSVQDVGVLAGFALPVSDDWRVVPSAGLAAVWAERVVPGDCRLSGCWFGSGRLDRDGPFVGLPLELSLRGRDDRWLQLGFTAFGNLNRHDSFGGVTFDILVLWSR